MSISIPVDGDEDHTEQRGGNIAVKEEREEATKCVSKDPRLVNVSRCCQR